MKGFADRSVSKLWYMQLMLQESLQRAASASGSYMCLLGRLAESNPLPLCCPRAPKFRLHNRQQFGTTRNMQQT